MQAVVVHTLKGREEMLNNIMDSLSGCKYPVVVYYEKNFELGVFNRILKETCISEFSYFHDTCEIKDLSLLDFCFEDNPDKSVSFACYPRVYGMYLGKYLRRVLEKIEIPFVKDVHSEADFEITWTQQYAQADGNVIMIDNPLKDCESFVNKWGKKRMLLENQYLRKYKHRWHRGML